MSDRTSLGKEDPKSSEPSGPRGSSLSLRDKIVLGLAIIVLFLGLLVWARIEWGVNVFQIAQLWIYQNYGVSRAWAFTLAILIALLVTANLGFLVAAVLLGRRKDLNRLLVVSALVLIPGTVVYQLSNRDQCFNRTTEAPLCALYKKPNGTFVLHRVDDAEPPSTWRKVRTASREDVVRYGASEDDQKMLRPTRITWETCGPGTEFFDSVSGDPKVFFVKIDNHFELFDRPGFHPQVNARLEPVTIQSAREICKTFDAQKAKAEREAKEAELAAIKALDAQKAKAEREAKEAELAAIAEREKALQGQESVRAATPQAAMSGSSSATTDSELQRDQRIIGTWKCEVVISGFGGSNFKMAGSSAISKVASNQYVGQFQGSATLSPPQGRTWIDTRTSETRSRNANHSIAYSFVDNSTVSASVTVPSTTVNGITLADGTFLLKYWGGTLSYSAPSPHGGIESTTCTKL